MGAFRIGEMALISKEASRRQGKTDVPASMKKKRRFDVEKKKRRSDADKKTKALRRRGQKGRICAKKYKWRVLGRLLPRFRTPKNQNSLRVVSR